MTTLGRLSTGGLGLAISASLLLPVSAATQDGEAARLFRTADRCMACHNGLVTPGGEDVSIGFDWRASMMANAARDPYWQAAVRREALDHPSAAADIEEECSRCHMPMAHVEARAADEEPGVFEHLPVSPGSGIRAAQLAADGVSCAVCHQIEPQGLGSRETFVGRFQVDTTTPWGERRIYGPFQVDAGRTRIMRSAALFRPTRGDHLQGSELCASCHTLYTHTLGPDGEVVGELPEQVPYLEWQHSSFAGERSCQSCHMPPVEDSVALTGVLGQPRPGLSRHSFRGGNFFMLRMLNRYRAELGVEALPQELDAAARKTVEHLATASAEVRIESMSVEGGELRADVVVENLAGHKLPTAYPSRRAWLHVTVTDGSGLTVFESGALRPDGSIVENNNDAFANRYEPHYTEVVYPEQVQIYEAILVDPQGEVTTGLLTASDYVKDNRLLPRGFDKTAAGPDIAVRGEANDDPDFEGEGDRVRYVVTVQGAPGPFTVRAELWYQPIAYRWAQNLRRQPAPETNRFVEYYEEMARGSATLLAAGEGTAR